MVPDNLRYTKDHEWIRVDGEVATVGITDHAQSELGDIVFVELPRPGTTLGQHDSFGSVESVKAVSDIYSPASGEVAEVNNALADAPEKVNADPYGEGWIMKMRLADSSQIQNLMTAAQYTEYIGAES
jgi:glycine cleavage system H protein